jgi:hypothetical protein
VSCEPGEAGRCGRGLVRAHGGRNVNLEDGRPCIRDDRAAVAQQELAIVPARDRQFPPQRRGHAQRNLRRPGNLTREQAARVAALPRFGRAPETPFDDQRLAAHVVTLAQGILPSVKSTGADVLRGLVYLGGAVATAAGFHSMAAGARSLPGSQKDADPILDSELRYYGGFYMAYGLAALRVAPRADRDARAVRALAGALFASGLARAGGWVAKGPPHPLQRGLLAIELAAPPLLVALQARVSAAATG